MALLVVATSESAPAPVPLHSSAFLTYGQQGEEKVESHEGGSDVRFVYGQPGDVPLRRAAP
jgi:hypothetical protein